MRHFFVVVLGLVCLLQACKKKSGPANGNSVQQDNSLDSLVGMTAKVNGGGFSTDSVYGYLVRSHVDSGKVDFLVTGSLRKNDTPSTITFTITNYVGPKTYSVSPPTVSATYYLGNERHFATAGRIVVSSHSEYGVIGSFYFTADSTNISEGAFNVAMP